MNRGGEVRCIHRCEENISCDIMSQLIFRFLIVASAIACNAYACGLIARLRQLVSN